MKKQNVIHNLASDLKENYIEQILQFKKTGVILLFCTREETKESCSLVFADTIEAENSIREAFGAKSLVKLDTSLISKRKLRQNINSIAKKMYNNRIQQ